MRGKAYFSGQKRGQAYVSVVACLLFISSLFSFFPGPVDDPFEEGGMSLGFTGSTVINREDYGIMWNETWEGGVMVGREVRITLNVEADLVRG